MNHRDNNSICLNCGTDALRDTVIAQTVEINYEGGHHTVEILKLPVAECSACGEVFFDNRADEQIDRAIRSKFGLMQPEEIRSCREILALTQVELAASIRSTPESISRWENGRVIQSRAHDTLLRLYFKDPSQFSAESLQNSLDHCDLPNGTYFQESLSPTLFDVMWDSAHEYVLSNIHLEVSLDEPEPEVIPDPELELELEERTETATAQNATAAANTQFALAA